MIGLKKILSDQKKKKKNMATYSLSLPTLKNGIYFPQSQIWSGPVTALTKRMWW